MRSKARQRAMVLMVLIEIASLRVVAAEGAAVRAMRCDAQTVGLTEAGLDELKKRGANFISFFPTPLETMGSGLGRYDENRCGRLDQLFAWCEQRGLHISWSHVP